MALDDTVEALAARLDRPVVLYDVELNLIAFTAHGEGVDEVRRSVILSRRGTSRAREMIRSSGANQARGAVRIPVHEDTGTPGRVIYPVRRRDRLVGYVAYIDDRPGQPLTPDHTDALDASNETLGEVLFARELDRQRDREQAAHLVRGLLSTDPRDRADTAAEATSARRLPAAESYATLVLTTGPGHDQPVLTERDRLTLEDCLIQVLRLLSGRAAGAVLEREAAVVHAPPIDRETVAKIVERESAGAVRLGFGCSRASLETVAGSFREAGISARAAWLAPAEHGSGAAWADLGADRLLLQLPLAELTEADLPAPVQRLLSAGPGPDLAETLERYLDAGCDAQATARALMIHRSTLYYRLDRIRQICGVDLADGRVRRDLHLGLRVALLARMRPTLQP